MVDVKAIFGLTVLTVINAINYADRLSITTVLQELKSYYGVEEKDTSALASAFLVGYMFTAPVFGYLGDRYSRKWLVIGGVSFWCLACVSAIAFEKNQFHYFMLTRALVGIGEASYSTIAPTLIGDLFPPKTRKKALSIYNFAIPIGTGLGFMLGYIALTIEKWRLVFLMTPSIGVVAIILLLFFEEPIRGQSDAVAIHSEEKDESSIKERLVYLFNIKSYVWSTIGFTCCIFTMGALSWHAINFMTVARGPDYKKTATYVFGILISLGGLVGVTLGSTSAQYFRATDGRADPLVCTVGVLIAVPMTLLGLLCAKESVVWSWFFLFLSVTSLSTNWAIISDMLLSVVVPTRRAFASSCQILISHMFGDALSPFIVGALKDHFDQSMDPFEAFLWSLSPTLVVLVLGVPAFLWSARYYVKDVEALRSTVQDEPLATTRPEDASLTDFATSP